MRCSAPLQSGKHALSLINSVLSSTAQKGTTRTVASSRVVGARASSDRSDMASNKGSQEGHHARKENRLASSSSPYLLQHKHNPVDWYTWSPEALERARREDKPIFLSVGYSTCHWCHVMERESFEDEATAAIMNRHFINIKVDREERPDVDRVYMSYVQATSGRGGWPMSVWLTPDLEPFFGGSYFPKQDIMQHGEVVMPSFTAVLRRIASMWHSPKREDLKAKGTSVMSQLRQALEGAAEEEDGFQPELAEHSLTVCTQQLERMFDDQYGGFGGPPKFPRPAQITALLRAHPLFKGRGESSKAEKALMMATFTLERMARGGMYDHIGGGFHRYSVDELWHVPHFEKMTYDNPQLVLTYLATFQVTGDQRFAAVARGVLDYLLRDMTSPAGGVYSAEDADSFNPEVGHKTEGFFYLWTQQEVEEVVGPERAQIFCRSYHFKPPGNCTFSELSDPHREFVGRNVPILLRPLEEKAERLGVPLERLKATLAACRKELHAVRAKRPRPSLDDKIVAAWNGMAMSAYATAARVLPRDGEAAKPAFPIDGRDPSDYLAAAVRVAECVRDHLWDPSTRTLLRNWCNGPAQVPAFAEDYAWVVAGLLDLYEAGGGTQWLEWAVQLQDRMDALFYDPVGGGYFATTTEDRSIKIRIKDDYDGAEPTASSVAAGNLLRLAALIPQRAEGAGSGSSSKEGAATRVLSYHQRAVSTFAAFRERLFEAPVALPQLASAGFLLLSSPLRQVVVASGQGHPGGLGSPAAQALLTAAHTPHVPDKAVILVDLADPQSVAFWDKHNPEALAMVTGHYQAHGAAGGAPVALVCQNYTCQSPTSEPQKVIQLLKQEMRAAVAGAPAGPADLKEVTGLPGM